MQVRAPDPPFSVSTSTYLNLYPSFRDDDDRNDEAAIKLVQAAGTPQQLLSAVQWIVPGRMSDTSACLQLVRLRNDFTDEDRLSALDSRRPESMFKHLARRLWTEATKS